MLKASGEWPRPVVEFGAPGPNREEVLARMERSRRNSQWLQTHWADLLPAALGKFLAVAGEEGFIADGPEEACAWVRRTHPEEDAATVQYVIPEQGPRIYAAEG
jgi:hypothetical protein